MLTTLFSAIALVSGLAALVGCVLLRRAQLHWRARCMALEAQLPALRHEMQLVASINQRAGRQLRRLERTVPEQQLQSRLQNPIAALDAAIHAARGGADSSRLSSQHGLSRAEADLVARLHGRPLAV